MHQYKTITQTLFVLSILNFVFAAPVVTREARDIVGNAMVVADDVTTMSKWRRATAAPSDSTTGASKSMPAHSFSAADAPAMPDSNTEAPVPAHPLPAADGSAPVHDSTTAEGPSTAPHYVPVTLDMVKKTPKFYQKPAVQKVAGLTVIVSILATIGIYSALHNNKKDG